jgi:hypothetical protein
MAKSKTTGKVDQGSDRLIGTGATILIVSGLFTIGWRVGTAGKVPFWSSWPGLLGFAVVCAAIVVMAVGISLGQHHRPPVSGR